MALKLSPEFFVSKLIKLATNGRIISAKFRRILTIILIPVWGLSIAHIIMSILDIRTKINEHNRNPNDYPDYVLSHNLREPIEIIIYMIVLIVVPWLLLRLVFWVYDAKEIEQEKKK